MFEEGGGGVRLQERLFLRKFSGNEIIYNIEGTGESIAKGGADGKCKIVEVED